MNSRTRRLIRYGEMCGFTLQGLDGRGHYRMVHPNGSVVRVSGSPGDWNGDTNCEAEMRRKSGVVPVRPNAARFRFTRRQGFSMRRALAEKDDSKSGLYSTKTEPIQHPRLVELRHQADALRERIEATPYPYLIQELRRLEQSITELSKVTL